MLSTCPSSTIHQKCSLYKEGTGRGRTEAWHFPCTSLSLCYKNVGKSFSLFFLFFMCKMTATSAVTDTIQRTAHTHTHSVQVCVCVYKLLSNCCEGISRRWILCCANFLLGYLIEFTTRRRCQILSKIHTIYYRFIYYIYTVCIRTIVHGLDLSLPCHAQHICCCLLLPPQVENFSMIVY